MIQPKISVIIPVYNTEDYLEETLMSLLNQTMIDDIEVLMIDDGSTDDSRYIIEKYAIDYDNFHAYHKKNEGQGVARNYGLSLAKGEYIHFLDSDDYLPPKAYETLYDLAFKNKSDMVCGNALRFSGYNVWEDIIFKNSFNTISDDVDNTNLSEFPQFVWDTVSWNKLYKKDFLLNNNLKFPNKKIFFEDLLFSLESYILAENITITKDIIYYWRVRKNHTSVTQQFSNSKNFMDRLNILRDTNELFSKYSVNENIKECSYLKWLYHDLKFYLKRFHSFPNEEYKSLFNEICEVVDLIPVHLIKSLNNYKRVIFEIILNKDYDTFILFAPLEEKLWVNPTIPEFLDEKYKKYFDFSGCLIDEEINSRLTDVECNGHDLLINFETKMNYLSNEYYEVYASLKDENEECPLKILNSNQIQIPLNLINNDGNFRVKIFYKFKDFEKISYLVNNHRKSIILDDFDVDLNIGVNSYLYIHLRNKNDNLINISSVSFENNHVFLVGDSKNKVDELYIQNFITLNKIYFNIIYIDDDKFQFNIPFSDLLGVSVKKWELNCDLVNSIKLSGKYDFFTERYHLRFLNLRNKIIIQINLFNSLKELDKLVLKNKELNEELFNLKDENKKLKIEKNKLNEEIFEYKSRKVVKLIDKFRT